VSIAHSHHSRRAVLVSFAAVLVLAVALSLLLSSDAHAALQKLAGY
jgi:hypothetical protein